MTEAMVTARMSREKKDAANRVLEQLGTNASQAVNKLYDYVLEKKELPFEIDRREHKYTKKEIADAVAFIDSFFTLPVDNHFANMTDDEIKQERLYYRGLMDK